MFLLKGTLQGWTPVAVLRDTLNVSKQEFHFTAFYPLLFNSCLSLPQSVKSLRRQCMMVSRIDFIFQGKLATYRVVFMTGSALKVLSVEDGKIPTKKVKVRICHSENVKF